MAARTKNDSAPRKSASLRTILICLGLALAVWIIFGQTLRHEFVNVDDDVYVTENAHVASGLNWAEAKWAFANLQAGFWHPLTWLSFMFDATCYGLRPSGFHLTNVLIHTANTLLLFLVLRRMTATAWPSAFVSALFAIHPLHVESAAWISERKGLLSTTFFLLSLWAYARYAHLKTPGQPTRRWHLGTSIIALPFSFGFWALSFVCFACGLMSKTMIVTLPIVMLLLDYWPLQRWERASIARLFLEKIPYFVLALAAGWLTIHAEKDIGALAQGEALPLKLRMANAAVSSLRYLYQTVWPTNLAVLYPYPNTFPTGLVLLSVFLLIAFSATALWAARRFPYITVGWFWYLITLSPVSGLIQVGGHSRADRYSYIPLIGIFLIVAWALAAFRKVWPRQRTILIAMSLSVLTALVFVAHAQTAHWRNSISLWIHALAATSDNPEARHNLADAYAAQDNWTDAIPQYEQALQLKPDHVLAHDALGVALAMQGRLDEAIPHFERALQLRPSFAVCHYNLSVALAAKGRLDEAMQQCEVAIQLKPDYPEAHQNLAAGLAARGKLAESAQQFEQALTLATAQGKTALAETIRARLRSVQAALPPQASP